MKRWENFGEFSHFRSLRGEKSIDEQLRYGFACVQFERALAAVQPQREALPAHKACEGHQSDQRSANDEQTRRVDAAAAATLLTSVEEVARALAQHAKCSPHACALVAAGGAGVIVGWAAAATKAEALIRAHAGLERRLARPPEVLGREGCHYASANRPALKVVWAEQALGISKLGSVEAG